MQLMTKGLYEKLPPLYTNEKKKPEDVPVIVKFFDPTSGWTWYAIEGSKEGDNFIFFGYVYGIENELGYFSLNELESIELRLGLGIERDTHFGKHTLKEVMERRL